MHFCTAEELPPRPDQEEVAADLLGNPPRALTPMEVDNSTYHTAPQPLLPLSLPVTTCSAAKPSNHLSSKQPPPSSLPASKHPTMVSHSLLLTNATYPPLQCKMTKREIHHKYPSAEDGLKEWNPCCEKCMIRRKTVQQCAPGHEVYNDEGNVSYGNFPPVVLINNDCTLILWVVRSPCSQLAKHVERRPVMTKV